MRKPPFGPEKLIFHSDDINGDTIITHIALRGSPRLSNGLMPCGWAAAYTGRGIQPQLLWLPAATDEPNTAIALAIRGVVQHIRKHFPQAEHAPLRISLRKCSFDNRLAMADRHRNNGWLRTNGKPAKSIELWELMLSLKDAGRLELKEFSGTDRMGNSNDPASFYIVELAAKEACEKAISTGYGVSAFHFAPKDGRAYDANDFPSFGDDDYKPVAAE